MVLLVLTLDNQILMLTQWFQETLTLGISARAIASAVRRFNAWRVHRIEIRLEWFRRNGWWNHEEEIKKEEIEQAKLKSGVSKVVLEEILCC